MTAYAVQVLLALVAMLGVALGAYATYRGTVQAKTIESEATPYERLSDRVGALESQVEALLSEKWRDRAYIQVLLEGWPYHKPVPGPMPPWVAAQFQRPLDQGIVDRLIRGAGTPHDKEDE